MKKSLLLLTTLICANVALASHADDNGSSWLSFFSRKNEIAPATDAAYKKECGSCHFPYQPGWLPESSWRKLLSGDALADHFGEDAELPSATQQHILDYAVKNAADKSLYKRSKKIMASLNKGEVPTRITDVTYIRRKHHEIPGELIKGDKVKSLSFCDACHTQAKDAVFDEDTVVVPGKGKWTW
jgi:Dihaem cytochrome c